MKIRAAHPAAFRSGEWAELKDTVMLPQSVGVPDRPCYVVEFADGVVDFWAMNDPDSEYEFAGTTPAR